MQIVRELFLFNYLHYYVNYFEISNDNKKCQKHKKT